MERRAMGEAAGRACQSLRRRCGEETGDAAAVHVLTAFPKKGFPAIPLLVTMGCRAIFQSQ
jgi:hypothetical protein